MLQADLSVIGFSHGFPDIAVGSGRDLIPGSVQGFPLVCPCLLTGSVVCIPVRLFRLPQDLFCIRISCIRLCDLYRPRLDAFFGHGDQKPKGCIGQGPDHADHQNADQNLVGT